MSLTHVRTRTISNNKTPLFTTTHDDSDTIYTHLSFGVFPSTLPYPHSRPLSSAGSGLSSYTSLSPDFENDLPLPTPGAFPPLEEMPSSILESAFPTVPMTPTMGGTSAFSPQLGSVSTFSPFGLETSTASPRQRKGAGAGGVSKGSPLISSGLAGQGGKKEKCAGEKEKEKERKARMKRNLSYGGTIPKEYTSAPLTWTTTASKDLTPKPSTKASSSALTVLQVCDVSTQPFLILPQTRILLSQLFSFTSSSQVPTVTVSASASTPTVKPTTSSAATISKPLRIVNLVLILLFWTCVITFMAALSGHPSPSHLSPVPSSLRVPYHSLTDTPSSEPYLGPLDHDDTLTHPSPFAPNPLFKGFSPSLSNARSKSLEGKGLGYEWIQEVARSPFFFPDGEKKGKAVKGVAVGGRDGGEIGRRAMFWQRFGQSGGGPNGYGWTEEEDAALQSLKV